MATTIQVVTTAKVRREVEALAKHEKRSLSNMAAYLLLLGKLKYHEEELAKAKVEREAVSA